MKRWIVAALVVALASTVLAQTADPNVRPIQPAPAPTVAPTEPPLESAKRITVDEADKLVRAHKAVIVDVRNKESYDVSHIKGSVNIPEGDIVTRLGEVPAGKMIITYCA